MIKKTLFFGMVLTVGASAPSFAEPRVTFLSEDAQQLRIKLDVDQQPFSVFEQKGSLWFVFAHREAAKFNLPKAVRERFKVKEQSLLDVPSGTGAVFSFDVMPKILVSVKNTAPQVPSPSLLILKEEGVRVSHTAPQILTAKTLEGETGFSVVPTYTLNSNADMVLNLQQFKHHPSYAGYVFSKNNAPVKGVYSQEEVFISETSKKVQSFAFSRLNKTSSVKEKEDEKTKDVTQKGLAETGLDASSYVIRSGASKIILKRPPQPEEENKKVEKAQTQIKTDTPKDQQVEEKQLPSVTKPLKEEVKAVAEPVTQKDVEMPAETKDSVLFAQHENVKDEELSQHRIAPIKHALEPLRDKKPSPEKRFKKDKQKFKDALAEIKQAQAELEQVYIPPVKESQEDMPTIKPLTQTVDAQSPTIPSAETDFIEETNFLETARSNTAPKEDDLSLLAKEVLGDFVDIEKLEEIEDKTGVSLKKESFFEPLELLEVNKDDPLFRFFGSGSDLDYGEYYRKLLEALAHVKNAKEKNLYRLALAKLTIGYHRPFEALMVLDNMEKDPETGLFVDEGARLLAMAANILIHRYDDAAFYMKNIGDRYPEDEEIWRAMYLETQDKDAVAADLFEKNLTFIRTTYPPALVKEVYLSYGRILLRLERLSRLKQLVQELATYMPNGQLPAEGLLMLAQAHIIERNDDLAETLLAQAAASENPNVAFMAQYAFVDFLLSNGDLGTNRAISHLETLRYLWRGGKVEAEILQKLGRMYIANGRHRLGLWRLKQHNTYFPQAENDVETTSEVMSIAFRDMFLDKTIETVHQPLEMLGIYYDFRELTPPGREGDQLISEIAERLRMLRLFERAITLLESQLKYRTKTPEDKAIMGMRLGHLYYLNRQYKEGLNVLNRTETPKLSAHVLAERGIVHARLLIGLRRYSDALKVLQDVENPEADYLIAHISWILETYPQVIAYHQPKFDNPKNMPEEWGHNERVAITELAVAYNMTGRLRELESLQKRYMKQISSDDNLKNMFNFLLMERGSDIVVLPEKKEDLWPKLTDAMRHYHTFVDFYKEFRKKRHESREEKDIFNRRMRQMSAPARLH